jgi:hypothetical protein
MVNIIKAINAAIEIKQKQFEIKELQDIVDENLTVYQFRNKSAKFDILKIEAAIEASDYVGHILKYKDVELNLCTNGYKERICDKIMEELF